MEWTDKSDGTRPTTTYRVSLFSGVVHWQRKEEDAEKWETPKLLPTDVWRLRPPQILSWAKGSNFQIAIPNYNSH